MPLLDTFFQTRPGLFVSDEFRSFVVAEASFGAGVASATRSVDLRRDTRDGGIKEMLGDGHLFGEENLCVTIAQMITDQESGKEGKLLNNGASNIFFTASCTVCVYWRATDCRWYVLAWRDDRRWDAGDRAFSPE
ncbi:MAG: hypothetical protein KBC06_01750 [Candidatus Pacebacteria bacterium]|nr:hypothetical protein [Candidatus Paceibacterota bacterium]